MSASEPSLLARVPGMSRLRELLDGLAPRERTLLGALLITVLGLLVLGGGVLLYDQIDTLEEQTDAMQRALRDIAKKRGPYLQARARAARASSSPVSNVESVATRPAPTPAVRTVKTSTAGGAVEGTPWINRFFKVDDRVKSFWNLKHKLPVYSEKKLHEGFYKRNHSVYYDILKKTAHWEGKRFSGNTDIIKRNFVES